jgi:hypothetical protein
MSEQMKILIAYDGSDCANAAIEDLHRAGLPPEAEVLMMSVADVFLPPSSSPEPTFPANVPAAVQRAWAQATHAVDEARALAQHARTRLLTAFPTWASRRNRRKIDCHPVKRYVRTSFISKPWRHALLGAQQDLRRPCKAERL